MKRPDYRTLQALDAVIRERGFERAAQKLCITQSAVSQRIKQLENMFGQPLLVRTVPPRPTEQGQKLLALLRQVSAPFVLIVVNNNGGQIFSLLPTPQAEREQFYLMPQNVHFDHAAAMFGLAYHRPESWAGLESALAGAWRTPQATLIELVVDPQEGAQTLQQLLAQVSQV